MSVDETSRTADFDALRSLCVRAAADDVDRAEQRHLRAEAVGTTALLVADGRLPPHLHVEPGDPWVVVARTLDHARAHLDREAPA